MKTYENLVKAFNARHCILSVDMNQEATQPTATQEGPGRHRKYDRAAVLLKFLEYIRNTDSPRIDKFCGDNEIPPSTFSEWPEARDLIEIAKAKVREDLVQGGLTGRYNPTMAIFTSKNYGMSDRQIVEHAGALTINQPFQVVGVEPQRQRKTEK